MHRPHKVGDAGLVMDLPEPTMADEDFAPQPRGLWAVLCRRRTPAPAPTEDELGYESALPWTQSELPDDDMAAATEPEGPPR